MHELFARSGIEEWQELYTAEEVDDCFNKHVIILNYNEVHKYDNLISVTAISSGFHLGASNWLIEVGTYKIGLLRNSSEESDFRYPLPLYSEPL